MDITQVYDDALRIVWPPGRPSATPSGELVPVEAEVNEKQRGKSEGDDADRGEGVAKMAPVARPEIKHAAGNESKRDGIGAGHPLAMLDDLAVTRGKDGCGGADDPGSGLHGGSWQAGAAGGEGDPGECADKDGEDVGAAEDAMEFQVTLANARRELHRTGQESDDAAECMGDEEIAVGDDLQTVGVVHGVIGEEKNF